MEFFERGQCALAVDHRLLPLLGRLHRDNDFDRLIHLGGGDLSNIDDAVTVVARKTQ